MTRHERATNDRTRYGHAAVGGGSQDQGERKDEGWRSRQGGDQSRSGAGQDRSGGDRRDRRPSPAQGSNTQGELAGIGGAADRSRGRLEAEGLDVASGEIPEAGHRDRRAEARDDGG